MSTASAARSRPLSIASGGRETGAGITPAGGGAGVTPPYGVILVGDLMESRRERSQMRRDP